MELSNIANKIVTLTASLTYTLGGQTKNVPAFVAYVEETDTVPFCCFQITSDTAKYAKKGCIGWDSAVSLYVVSPSDEEGYAIVKSVTSAIDAARSATFRPSVANITPVFQDGCWMYRIDYNFLTLI